jgi:hypothetical protein
MAAGTTYVIENMQENFVRRCSISGKLEGFVMNSFLNPHGFFIFCLHY